MFYTVTLKYCYICSGINKKLYLQKAHQLIHDMVKHEHPTDAPPAPIFQLTLRRTHLLEDTFRQLSAADHCAFRRQLLVNMSALLLVTTLMKASSPHIVVILSAVTNEPVSVQVVPDRVSEPLPASGKHVAGIKLRISTWLEKSH